MSWSTDDGKHEAWMAPTFADGALGSGGNANGVLVSRLADGKMLDYYDWQTRADSEVIGWLCACECGWRGPLWTRVASQDEHDPAERKVYSEDAWADDELCFGEWKQHIAPVLALAEVEEAAVAVAAARRRLDAAVAKATAAGADARDIARVSTHGLIIG